MTQLVTVTRGIIDYFDPIFSAIGEAAREISGLNPAVSEAVGNFLGAMSAISELGTAMGVVVLALQQSEANIKAVFDVLLGAGQLFWNSMQLVFDGLVSGAIFMSRAVIDAIRAMIPDFLEEKFAPQLAQASKDMDELGRAVKANFVDNSREAREGLDRLVNGVKDLGDESVTNSDKIKTTGDAIETVEGKTLSAEQELEQLGKSLATVGLSSEDAKKYLDLYALSTSAAAAGSNEIADSAKSAGVAVKDSAATFGQADNSASGFFETGYKCI